MDFKTYADRDVSIRWIMEELHRSGVRSPTGKERWSPMTLNKLLRNRNYVGDLHWNQSTVATFHEVQGEQIVKRKEGKGHRRRNAEGEWVITTSVTRKSSTGTCSRGSRRGSPAASSGRPRPLLGASSC